jgi:putative membrane protein insertion efficiency factor
LGPRSLSKAVAKTPIHLYRWTLKPLMGLECRHLPTCSEYALDAVDTNGAWRGFWLTIARLSRCHPWGSSGFDPAPDIRHERHMFAPWLYGRWRHCDGKCHGDLGERPTGHQNFTPKS